MRTLTLNGLANVCRQKKSGRRLPPGIRQHRKNDNGRGATVRIETKANVGGQKRSADVGQFVGGASSYGVQDLAGNVAEWVSSYYQPYPGNTTANPDFGNQNRVVRGGTYKGDIEDARTTRRLYHTPQLNEAEKKNRAFLIGFRCGISADDLKFRIG